MRHQNRKIIGVDFTSSPRRAKPITVAVAQHERATEIRLEDVFSVTSIEAFQELLASLTPWLGAFDFPFGLPLAFVKEQGWPTRGRHSWARLMDIVNIETRAALVDRARAYCEARPPGQKFAHRDVDHLAGSSPSMKWVNPPVLQMLHAGVPVLRALDCAFPAHGVRGRDDRIALEGYPGVFARSITRASYKSDDRARQTPERRRQRERILNSICTGSHPLHIRVSVSRAQRQNMIEDASGDTLDAVLCALEAAWACEQPGFGIPVHCHPVEGWIAGIVPHNAE